MSTSKTPPSSETPHSQRRQSGGARIELSERVTLRVSGSNDEATEGWTLNVSRGGLRAVVEHALDPALEYQVEVGDGPARRACIAWSKGEADGQIVGLRFLDVEGSVPPEDGTTPAASGP
ncbi:MAG TPA: PilZ domain-containing protein [Polyangiaceae bacterium]|nr:PilZ domain-containing protein [Polyangiaceae bacterium]